MGQQDFKELMETVAAVAAAAGALGGMSYGAYRAARIGFHFSRRAIAFSGRTVRLYELIEKELQPNGGTSLRDAISRIEIRQMLTEQRYRAILAASEQAYFECDVNGECVWANRQFLRLVGRLFDEVRGNGWVSHVVEDEREETFAAWKQAVEQHRDYTGRFHVMSADGEVRRVFAQSICMFNSANEAIGYVGTVARIEE